MERLSFELVCALRAHHLPVRVIAHRAGKVALPLFFIWALPVALWRARQADVIHLGDPLLAIIGWAAGRLWNKPVVVTVHGLDITYEHPLYQWYLRHWFDDLDHYVGISQHVAELLERRGIRGFVTVIHPGFFDSFYDTALKRADLDKIIGVATHNRFVIATVGRLVRRKGHEWFIRSVLPHLPERTLYIIAGDGPAGQSIALAARQAGVTEKVIMLGRVSPAAKKILYNTIDVFIQPNIAVPHNVEGFGIVLVEAASCGRLVMAARSGGITDAIIDQATGMLLPEADSAAWTVAIQAAAGGSVPTGLSPTSIRSQVLRHYAWPAIISRYLALYQRLGRERVS